MAYLINKLITETPEYKGKIQLGKMLTTGLDGAA